MTILGKILVIANLIFSLVTGGLIIAVFVSRTNWKDSYDKLRNYYTISEANARAYAKEVDDARAAADAELSKLKGQLAAAGQARDQAKRGEDELRTESKSLETRVQLAEANMREATEEMNRRRGEIENLKAITREKDEKVVQLEAQNKGFKDEAIAAQIAARSEQQRNQELLRQLAELHKELERRPASGGIAANGSQRRPPTDDVEGTVVETDSKSGLIRLSIGSDHGLAKGNTLEVYRLQPKPEYVGAVTIVDAHFHESVARPIMPLRAGPVQKGDTVTSRITTSRR